MDNAIDLLSQQLEDKISLCPSISNAGESAAHVNVAAQNDTLSNAQLKKKEVRTRSSKRQKLGWEEKYKGRKKGQRKTLVSVQIPMVCQISLTSALHHYYTFSCADALSFDFLFSQGTRYWERSKQ
jgi:hypothetical protein